MFETTINLKYTNIHTILISILIFILKYSQRNGKHNALSKTYWGNALQCEMKGDIFTAPKTIILFRNIFQKSINGDIYLKRMYLWKFNVSIIILFHKMTTLICIRKNNLLQNFKEARWRTFLTLWFIKNSIHFICILVWSLDSMQISKF